MRGWRVHWDGCLDEENAGPARSKVDTLFPLWISKSYLCPSTPKKSILSPHEIVLDMPLLRAVVTVVEDPSRPPSKSP